MANNKVYLSTKDEANSLSARITTAQSTADTANNTATLANNAANAAETNSVWRYNDAIGKITVKADINNPVFTGDEFKFNGSTQYRNKVVMGYGNTSSGDHPFHNCYIFGSENNCSTGGNNNVLGSNNTCNGVFTYAIGRFNKVNAQDTYAFGSSNELATSFSYALGQENYISTGRLAVGYKNNVSNRDSMAIGEGCNTSVTYNIVLGRYNASKAGFIIGNGSNSSTRSNMFRADSAGTYASGGYNTSGADYAEYFEWTDGNPNNEDRIGLFVTLNNDKIEIAHSENDFILGVVSGNPSVVGNAYEDQWKDMYLRDIYGRPIYEEVELPEEKDEEGKILISKCFITRPKLNPEYNNTEEYIGRSERSEWDAIGMLGKLVMRDDGTSQINRYVWSNNNGEAT